MEFQRTDARPIEQTGEVAVPKRHIGKGGVEGPQVILKVQELYQSDEGPEGHRISAKTRRDGDDKD